MTELVRPPSLRAFLDAGCEITTLPGWECLAEFIVYTDRAIPEDRRPNEAKGLRELAEAWLAGVDSDDPTRTLEGVEQHLVTRFLWEAEALEDPELADLFEAALPDDVRVRLRDNLEVLELEAAVYGPGVDPPVEWPG